MVCRRKGPLRAWRIADIRHPIYGGTGALLYGARWNSQGHAVIYASASYACAMLERLAHAGIGSIPKSQHWITINIPAIDIEEITTSDIPGWDQPDNSASRAYGDRWLLEKRTAVLVVPSVVARGDCNVLINPAHPDFHKIAHTRAEPVVWDRRLFQPKGHKQ
jgi:RES domain-containing protein